jgi:hypothetical protein
VIVAITSVSTESVAFLAAEQDHRVLLRVVALLGAVTKVAADFSFLELIPFGRGRAHGDASDLERMLKEAAKPPGPGHVLITGATVQIDNDRFVTTHLSGHG